MQVRAVACERDFVLLSGLEMLKLGASFSAIVGAPSPLRGGPQSLCV